MQMTFSYGEEDKPKGIKFKAHGMYEYDNGIWCIWIPQPQRQARPSP